MYTAHAALELYALAFEEAGCLSAPALRAFACEHGRGLLRPPAVHGRGPAASCSRREALAGAGGARVRRRRRRRRAGHGGGDAALEGRRTRERRGGGAGGVTLAASMWQVQSENHWQCFLSYYQQLVLVQLEAQHSGWHLEHRDHSIHVQVVVLGHRALKATRMEKVTRSFKNLYRDSARDCHCQWHWQLATSRT